MTMNEDNENVVGNDCTICIIKPDAIGLPWIIEDVRMITDEEGNQVEEPFVETLAEETSNAIVDRIIEAGFEILKRETMILSESRASDFYATFDKNASSQDLVEHLSSGPIVVLLLKKENAVENLLELLGQEDPVVARKHAEKTIADNVSEWPLRACFGADAIHNAIHGSSSVAEAIREIEFFFPSITHYIRTIAWWPQENQEIMASFKERCAADGIFVRDTISVDQVSEEQAKLLPQGNIALSQNIQIVLVEGENAIGKCKNYVDLDGIHACVHASNADEIVGKWFPDNLNPERVVLLAPYDDKNVLPNKLTRTARLNGFTLIADRVVKIDADVQSELGLNSPGKYSAFVFSKASAIQNYLHLISLNSTLNQTVVSRSSDEAELFMRVLFPELDIQPDIDAENAREYLGSAKTKSTLAPSSEKSAMFQSFLVQGLSELCRAKPPGIDAVRYLGEWLLVNNPNRKAASKAETDIAAYKSRRSHKPNDVVVARRVRGSTMPVKGKSDVGGDDIQLVFVLGGPGSGKGSMCTSLAQMADYELLSTAELLKEEVALGSPLGVEIKASVQANQIVPPETLAQVIQNAIRDSGSSRFLIDGFPRDIDQAKAFEKLVGRCSSVIHLNCSADMMKERCLAKGLPEDVIGKRIAAYEERTKPVIEMYQKLGLVQNITQEAADKISFTWEKVRNTFEPRVILVVGPPASGKTSICKHVESTYGYTRLSVKELMDAEAASGSQLGQRLKQIFTRSEPVPTAIIIDVLRSAISKRPSTKFVLDEALRNIEEAAEFESKLNELACVLHVTASPAVRQKRGQLSAKADTYETKTSPLVSYMRNVGRLVEVDSSHLSKDAMLQKASVHFSPQLVAVVGTNKELVKDRSVAAAQKHGWAYLNEVDVLTTELELQSSRFASVLEEYKDNLAAIPRDVKLQVLQHVLKVVPSNKFLVDGFMDNISSISVDYAVAVDACEATPFVQDMTLNGKLIFAGDQLEKLLRPRRVILRGSAGLEPEHRQRLIAKLAEDYNMRAFDASSAFDALHECAGSWEANVKASALYRFKNKSNDALTIDAEMNLAKRVMIERACGSSRQSTIILAPDDDTSMMPEVDDVLFLSCSDETARNRLVKDEADTAAYDAWANEKVSLAVSKVIMCDGNDDEILEAMHAPFLRPVTCIVDESEAISEDVSRFLTNICQYEIGSVVLRYEQLLRQEISSGSSLGRRLALLIQSAHTIPLDASMKLIRSAVAVTRADNVILVGYPKLIGHGFPFIHDQAFAIETFIGPIKICLDTSANTTSGDIVSCFESLDKYHVVDNYDTDAACAAIASANEKQNEHDKRLHWKPNDGSPQAEVQVVIDQYKPENSLIVMAEKYFADFENKFDEYNVSGEEVLRKLKEWKPDMEVAEDFGDRVSKAKWFEYVFCNMVEVPEEPKEESTEEADAAETAEGNE